METLDTLEFMVAGYVVIFIGLGTYILWMYFRWRKTRRELQQLLQDDKDQTTSPQ